MADDLYTMTYSSTAAEPFGEDELAQLLESSRVANVGTDLSGLLLYRGGRFLQVLEGPESSVRDAIDRIGRDSRHRDVRVLVSEPIAERRFADWTMAYEQLGESTSPPPEGFRDSFDDLESADATVTARAIADLTLWFRVRSGQRAT
ncbi:BLUF domain-containing protein [Microbacterium enclense]|uniref:BLUF domain-containing protein n=1 Tax=Microbacterium enclense TaxID=993073 RepID=A0A443J5Z9_9MICO|nr:BLUF domain-containing protein [Microbacterium enclense]RWR15895.1 BLUF domain-containing protein [Microbacterium enclense]